MYGGPAPGTNVSASTHVRVIENILNMFIYLIAVGGFEANISVHVLEGWLSDYAPSTTRAPITLKITSNVVLEADFHGQYMDMSDFSKNLAAWKIITRNGDKVHVVPLYIGIANIDDSITIRIDVNGHITTIKCSLD